MAKSPKSLNDLFVSKTNNNKLSANLSDNLSLYQQKTSQFRQIHKLLTGLLGDNIAQNIIVSNFNDCILQIETASPAIATHLKMRQSEALSLIRKEFNPATVTINVKVSPKSFSVKYANTASQSSAKKPEPAKVVKHIPDDAANLFEQLAASSDGPLKDTFARLAKHRKQD